MPTTYAIPNGRTAMNATTYSGNGSTQTIVNADQGTTGFKPDLVWVKARSVAYRNFLEDSVRGALQFLDSASTAAETTSAGSVTSFNTNGFSVGSNGELNASAVTYVGWQWVAGQGVNNTNTVGSITSTVSSNTTTGFSIVTYTGTGATGGTVGHGLSTAPQFIVVKDRTTTGYGWLCYHVSLGKDAYIQLNSSGVSASLSNVWGTGGSTSTTFGVYAAAGSSNNASGDSLVAYCWAPVAGFSQFGSYTGNGSSDGPFIYLGFRPKFMMFKNTNGAGGSWVIIDSSRSPYNLANNLLLPNANNAELVGDTGNNGDILSNGFKLRGTDGTTNLSGNTYIYAAFAENPFKYANAR
jgi:hypothetical protein